MASAPGCDLKNCDARQLGLAPTKEEWGRRNAVEPE